MVDSPAGPVALAHNDKPKTQQSNKSVHEPSHGLCDCLKGEELWSGYICLLSLMLCSLKKQLALMIKMAQDLSVWTVPRVHWSHCAKSYAQIERSCRSSQSWRCQKPPAEGWLKWFDLPASPETTHPASSKSFGLLSCVCEDLRSYLYFSRVIFLIATGHCDCRKVLDDALGVDSLPRTRFSTATTEIPRDEGNRWENAQCRCYWVMFSVHGVTHVMRTDWFSRSAGDKTIVNKLQRQ